VNDDFCTQGYQVQIDWGHVRGIDIVARRGADRFVYE